MIVELMTLEELVDVATGAADETGEYRVRHLGRGAYQLERAWRWPTKQGEVVEWRVMEVRVSETHDTVVEEWTKLPHVGEHASLLEEVVNGS